MTCESCRSQLAAPSAPESPAQLYGDHFRARNQVEFMRIADQFLPPAVPHYEEIVPGPDGPAQAGVRAHVLRFGVVLHEARQHQVWVPGICAFQLPESLDKVAFPQAGEVIL